MYPDFVCGGCRRRVMHRQKKGARHGQKRKRRKERKEAKERKEGKEKTIPGFITKPNTSTACAYARVRGDAPCVHMHILRSGRGGDGDHRQLLRFARKRLPHLGVVLPPLRPAANCRSSLLLRLMPEVRRNPQCHHSLPKLASEGSAITAFQSWLQKEFDAKGGVA